MSYSEDDKVRAAAWKQRTGALPSEAKVPACYIDQNGNSKARPVEFCLPAPYAALSLLPEVRAQALALFAGLGIPWHAGVDGGPSNHLVSSQVQCVNALGQMVSDPERIRRAFGHVLGRISRDEQGELIGYQRREVKRHVDQIVEYLDGDQVLFPNSIIIALPSSVRFRQSRGPATNDGLAAAGTLDILLPAPGQPRPGWLVDGQQRALALSRTKRQDLAVPITAFVADDVEIQRDQFLRVNNVQPLPRGLVTELLPDVYTSLSPKLAAKRIPSALVDLLNRQPSSPFHGLIRRASTPVGERAGVVVTDTVLMSAIEESLNSPAGVLYPYRNVATGETDIDGVYAVLLSYWRGVKSTFTEAWGLPPTQSRLMHGAGLRSMARLMDRVMLNVDAARADAEVAVVHELAKVAPFCRWTKGEWEELGVQWDALQNLQKDIRMLSNYLVRLYVQQTQRVPA